MNGKTLERPLTASGRLAVSASVGALLVLATLHLGFIVGGSAYWDPPWDDSAQSLAGLFAFVQDRWRFPLLSIGTYGLPEGANAANLNAIPLVSVVLKLLHPLTHHVPVFFGLWIAICRVLHPVAGAELLAALGERRLLPVFTVSLLFAGLPSLLDRITHADLSAQFLLPASLILYLRLVRAGSLRGISLAAFALLLTALLVHPYLLVMTFLPCAAALAERWRRGTTSASRAAGVVAAQMTGLLVVMLALGYFDAVSSPWPHYGKWSLNLLSPFLSAESTLLPAAGVIGETICLAVEGANYLGLGALVLVAVALVSARRDLAGSLRRHPVLAGALAGLTVFAVSNRIELGNTLLFAYPLPSRLQQLAEVFRASGRFFWPVTVALLAWCVAAVARALPWRAAVLVLALACAIQWVDLGGARQRSRARSARTETDALGPGRAAWRTLVTAHRSVETYPSYACGPGEENEYDLQLQLIAVRSRVEINSAYLSRPNKDCGREAEQARRAWGAVPPAGVLRVFYGEPGRPAAESEWPGPNEACRRFSGALTGIACSAAWSEMEATGRTHAFQPLARR